MPNDNQDKTESTLPEPPLRKSQEVEAVKPQVEPPAPRLSRKNPAYMGLLQALDLV